jgi:ribonucleoside-diphosphate reductase alpha chain
MRFWNRLFTVTDSRKTGGDAEAVARDAAVTLSLGLQHGVSIEAIRHAVTRNGSSGAPASIIGAVIDAVAGEN